MSWEKKKQKKNKKKTQRKLHQTLFKTEKRRLGIVNYLDVVYFIPL